MVAARHSLDGELIHWQTGETITAGAWIKELYEQVYPLACDRGVNCFLSPLRQILTTGNEAQRWLRAWEGGKTLPEIMTEATTQWTQQDQELAQVLL
jgi:predicted glutamate--cysteine ligase